MMLFKDHFHKQLNKKIMECNACKLKDNPGPILGYGGLDSSIMFIGDVAKPSDLKAGVPFTGIAKEKFTKVIKILDLKKGEYYITYFMKHTIGDTKSLNMLNTKPCLDLLLEEIELINPKIICSMGHYVTQYLMGIYKMDDAGKSMKELHGNGYVIPSRKSYKSRYTKRVDNRPKRYLIPTWSPAVDNSLMETDMFSDVMTIQSVMKIGILLFD